MASLPQNSNPRIGELPLCRPRPASRRDRSGNVNYSKTQQQNQVQTTIIPNTNVVKIRDKETLDWLIEGGRRNGVFTITVELTPFLATLLLERNEDNRPTNAKVSAYTRDIKSGDWDLNGEPIIIANTGQLNDGQHRCKAVVAANRSILTQITFGVTRESRTTVDTGEKRSPGQILWFMGHKDTNVLSHAVNTIIIFTRHGRVDSKPDLRPSDRERENWLNEHPDMQEHISFGRAVYTACHCSIGLFAALHYIFSKIDATDADTFFEKLISGEMLRSGDPVYKLRETLRKEASGKKRPSHAHVAARTIKTWNLFRKGKSARTISWRTKENPTEQFPMPE